MEILVGARNIFLCLFFVFLKEELVDCWWARAPGLAMLETDCG